MYDGRTGDATDTPPLTAVLLFALVGAATAALAVRHAAAGLGLTGTRALPDRGAAVVACALLAVAGALTGAIVLTLARLLP